MKKRLVVVVILLALAAGAWALYRWLRPDESSGPLEVSGTVEATDAQVGFESAGRITSIGPHEGDEVAAGAELARLDAAELEARRTQAAAQVAAAEAQLRELRAGTRSEEVARARAAVAAAREQLEEQRREHERTSTLYQGGAVAKEAFDRSATAVEVAKSRLDQEAEHLKLLEAGPTRETIETQEARLEEARANLSGLEARLDTLTLEAPFTGRVTVRHREPGEVVSPGQPVFTLQDLDDRWVRVYIPEDQLGAVHVGSRATIASDTFPDRSYQGRVFYVASEAEFTPKNVQTQKERVRLVYAIKVRVTGDPGHELKPGMPVDVAIPLEDTQADSSRTDEAQEGPR